MSRPSGLAGSVQVRPGLACVARIKLPEQAGKRTQRKQWDRTSTQANLEALTCAQ